ncbi:MAG: carboxypeptidase M32 [Chloroflexota bacterium]
MGKTFEALKERLTDVTRLSQSAAVLAWDQATYMPAAGAPARGQHLSIVERLAHDIFISEDTDRLLARSAEELNGTSRESDEASLIRVSRRRYDLQKRIPTALVGEIASHGALGYAAWIEAKRKNDFALFAPYLQKGIEYSRRLADLLGYEDQPYDALLDRFEPGMKTAQVQEIFAGLKQELVPLVRAIAQRVDTIDEAVLHQPFDEAGQERFGSVAAGAIGYDFSHGRQDRTAHPFETSFSRNDVRITTAFRADYLPSALFSTLHEAGHGMYEQGVAESLEGTPLAGGASLGVHESQSRLWENIVGRGYPFWSHFYPQLQAIFPEQLAGTDLEAFYRAINRVEPGYIRIDSDEVTYNLHIMLRLEMELALLSGELTVADAPEAWNTKMESYLGIRPATDTLGILQDVHWSEGMFGYFPTYSLGNLLSVQLFDAAVRDVPEIPDQLAAGSFQPLREWMTDKVYRHGAKFEPNELIETATGEPLQYRSYIKYLKGKFGAIYDLS